MKQAFVYKFRDEESLKKRTENAMCNKIHHCDVGPSYYLSGEKGILKNDTVDVEKHGFSAST